MASGQLSERPRLISARLPNPFQFLRPVTSVASGRVGLLLTGAIVFVALFGPFLAPYGPDDSVGLPYTAPSGAHWLGLDTVGRDVLSRWLWGGRSVLELAISATVIGVVWGVAIGLVAAYHTDWIDGALMRTTDLVLAFPPLILFLLVIVTLGSGLGPLIGVVGLYHAVRVSRVVRVAGREVVVQPYIEAAQARGDSAFHILSRDVLPNILTPVLIQSGFRFIYSVITIASVSFLGFGLQPPAADWGLMVSENREGLNLDPWGTIAPALTLAILTVGVSLVTDAYSRSVGRTGGRGREMQ